MRPTKQLPLSVDLAITGIAADVAGHCPVCNPNYTLDEQIAIEQRYKELHAG